MFAVSYSLVDISEHTAGGLGRQQDVPSGSSLRYFIYHKVQRSPHEASSAEAAQLVCRARSKPEI